MPVTVETALLIRKPAREVFEAFADPAITTRFWFTGSSGKLAPGARVTWTWAMYAAAAPVVVLAFEQDRRILIEWGDLAAPTRVEWTFAARGPAATFVTITNAGFGGDAAAVTAQALDAMGGFTLVLAGAKAYLEYGIALGLTADRHPDRLVSP